MIKEASRSVEKEDRRNGGRKYQDMNLSEASNERPMNLLKLSNLFES